eukprot:CAMPEP_0113454670 /NCGR_PEP_ID=MMETSP0014_2-20120614/7982_1 /TAXON_ID=2857 /ORGANISM="Nitzschia sp." /LENGTH=383 /DNA_ID=CAMNT_0000346081 /DNA_START=657 /DNA_END=1808 /DNA_ORIENTATION=- /assembly_acc=CAM_ASM_000159
MISSSTAAAAKKKVQQYKKVPGNGDNDTATNDMVAMFLKTKPSHVSSSPLLSPQVTTTTTSVWRSPRSSMAKTRRSAVAGSNGDVVAAARTTIDLALLLFADEERGYLQKKRHPIAADCCCDDDGHDDDEVSVCSSLSSHEDDDDLDKFVQVSCRRDFLDGSEDRRSIFNKYWAVSGETPMPMKRSDPARHCSLTRSKGMTELVATPQSIIPQSQQQPQSTPDRTTPTPRRSIFCGCESNNDLSSRNCYQLISELPSHHNQVSSRSLPIKMKNSDRCLSPTKSCLKKDHIHLQSQSKLPDLPCLITSDKHDVPKATTTGKRTMTLSNRSNDSEASLETSLTSASSATNNSSVRFDAQIRVISYDRSIEQDVNGSTVWLEQFAS